MSWASDGLTYRYNPPIELDMVQDNMRFLSLSAPSNRAKFLEDYFFFEGLTIPVYAINSFHENAFLEVFDIVKRNKMLQPLCYRKANPHIQSVGGYYPPTIRDIDLARFRYYDNRIKEFEDRLKTIEDIFVNTPRKITTSYDLSIFDSSGGDANDSAEA